MARKRELSSETRQSILVLRNEGYSMREIAKKLKISYNGKHCRSRLFTVDVDTGVLRVLFNEDASWGPVRGLFLKLQTLMYLSSCSVVQRGLPLLFLLWLEPVCAVL